METQENSSNSIGAAQEKCESTEQDQNCNRVLVRYRNRDIRQSDIALIQSMIENHPGERRTRISRLLCAAWDWRQSGGGLKEFACRDLLLRLEEWGHIQLPPRRNKGGGRKKLAKNIELGFEPRPIESGDLSKLVVRPVLDRKERLMWRVLVDRYHYLGDGVLCGEHLMYFAMLGDDIVACIGWGAASLRNPKRDQWIGRDFEHMRRKLHLVVNNQRFLILPWVKIKNLGSRVLSLNFKRLSRDWQTRYGHPVVLAETFVDVSRFHGTVYKAANWKLLGHTAGRSKQGNKIKHERGQVKAIFVYPSCINSGAFA